MLVVPVTELITVDELDAVKMTSCTGVVVATAGIIVTTCASVVVPSTVDVVPFMELTVVEAIVEVEPALELVEVVAVEEAVVFVLDVLVMTNGLDDVSVLLVTLTTVVAGVVVAVEH